MREIVLLVLALLLMMAMLATLAQRFRIPTPIFLVIGGLFISLVPGVPHLEIEPDLIFLVFLPPLLYEAAWFTSWRELWRWRRIVLVLAFGLVILTASAVAYTTYWVIPGFTLALGFILGGIISPPDAVAATSVLKTVNAPKSTLNILEGESLINDASSLLIFRFALDWIQTGSLSWQQVSISFLFLPLLGMGIGLAVAGVFYAIHYYLSLQARISILLTFLAPYIMYLTAEHFRCSGVIAVVSGGLFLSSRSHRFMNHTERVQGSAMWATVIFIINGLVFVLIGLELPIIWEGIREESLPEVVGYALLISLLVIVVRLAFALFAGVFTNFIGRFITVAVQHVGWRGPLIVGWAGMRGVVSLAAAFSIPLSLPDGSDFPHRSLLLFITFVVILVTLVLQGLSLPYLIRRVRPEELIDRLPENEQAATVYRHLQQVALNELQMQYAAHLPANPLLVNLKQTLENNLSVSHLATLKQENEFLTVYQKAVTHLHNTKRNELTRLRKQGDLDEDVLRKIEAQLDLEEEKNDHAIR